MANTELLRANRRIEMDIDRITGILHKQAVDAERDNITRAFNDFAKRICINNGYLSHEKLEVFNGDKESLPITMAEILNSIRSHYLNKRKEKLEKDAVADFMRKFSDFQGYIHGLEQYMEE